MYQILKILQTLLILVNFLDNSQILLANADEKNVVQLSNAYITWKRLDSDATEFTFTSALNENVSATNAWMGIGFNKNSKMVYYIYIYT